MSPLPHPIPSSQHRAPYAVRARGESGRRGVPVFTAPFDPVLCHLVEHCHHQSPPSAPRPQPPMQITIRTQIAAGSKWEKEEKKGRVSYAR